MQQAIDLPNIFARGEDYYGEVAKLTPQILSELAARGVVVKAGGEESGLHGVVVREPEAGSKAVRIHDAKVNGSPRDSGRPVHGGPGSASIDSFRSPTLRAAITFPDEIRISLLAHRQVGRMIPTGAWRSPTPEDAAIPPVPRRPTRRRSPLERRRDSS